MNSPPLFLRCARMLLVAGGLAAAAFAQTFTADFSSPTIDPNLTVNQWDGNGNYLPGTVGGWSVNSGGGWLSISLAPFGPPYRDDGPHVQTRQSTVIVPGDFVATVTIDTSANTGGSAGFFLETTGGHYTGIGFYNGNIQFSSSFPVSTAVSTGLSSATVRLIRSGETLTIQYKPVGGSAYTLLGSHSDPGLTGPAWFDLTNYAYAGPGWPDPITARFRDFSVVALAPPTLTVPADITVEATSASGAAVTFAASAHDAIDGDIAVAYSTAPGTVFPLGTSVVVVSAVNSAGYSASASFNVTVRDTTAPQITNLSASPESLWPPNHKMVPVTLSASVADAVDPQPTMKIVSVTSNDSSPDDCQITGDLTLLLRGVRKGSNARIYTITVRASDAAGNAATSVVHVRMAKDRP